MIPCLCPLLSRWTRNTGIYVTHQTHTHHNILTHQNWLQQCIQINPLALSLPWSLTLSIHCECHLHDHLQPVSLRLLHADIAFVEVVWANLDIQNVLTIPQEPQLSWSYYPTQHRFVLSSPKTGLHLRLMNPEIPSERIHFRSAKFDSVSFGEFMTTVYSIVD